jgi:hypothetical protein
MRAMEVSTPFEDVDRIARPRGRHFEHDHVGPIDPYLVQRPLGTSPEVRA